MSSDGLILHGYWRSSASYRVRIALALKGLAYEQQPVHLVKNGGEQHAADYVKFNPQHQVPTLQHGDKTLRQSMAIIEYLDETFGGHALLPVDAYGRSKVRELAQAIAIDVTPLGNLRVQQRLGGRYGLGKDERFGWAAHWVDVGFSGIEQMLQLIAEETGQSRDRFCYGDAPTMADCVLIPQVYNARRFGVDMSQYPRISQVDAHCQQLSAFREAAPESQPDALV